jgi:hypothetical protein
MPCQIGPALGLGLPGPKPIGPALGLGLWSLGSKANRARPFGLGLPGPKQIGPSLGLGLPGPKQIGPVLGLGLSGPRPDRTRKSAPLKSDSGLDSGPVRSLGLQHRLEVWRTGMAPAVPLPTLAHAHNARPVTTRMGVHALRAPPAALPVTPWPPYVPASPLRAGAAPDRTPFRMQWPHVDPRLQFCTRLRH